MSKQNYKQKYKELTVRLKSLIYENEIYQDQLKKSQDEYLQLTIDRDFLLDRLLNYENISDSTDCTDESDTELVDNQKNSQSSITPPTKKKKTDTCPQSTEKKKKKSTSSVKGTKKVKSTTSKSSQQNQSEVKDQNGSTNLIDKPQFVNSNQLDSLNDYPLNFNNNEDKLMFDDTSKLLFTNDLGNLTNVLNHNLTADTIDTRTDLDAIDLNLDGDLNGLTNLSQNLNAELGENMVGNLPDGNLNMINMPINTNLDTNNHHHNHNLPNQLLQTFELSSTQT